MKGRFIRYLQHALVVPLIMLTFPAAGASAQTANSLVAGAWAMQFEIDQDFDLTSFQGTTLSLKKHTSDGAAWRIGLGLDFGFSDGDESSIVNGEPSDITRESDANHQTINVVLNRLHYPSPEARVNFFYGYGPKLQYHRDNSVSSSYSISRQITDKSERTQRSVGAGLAGILGLEWFATDVISLLAEYGSEVVYESSKITRKTWHIHHIDDDDDRTTVSEEKGSGWSFDASAVKFGLSVYF